jgi:hypothetical protein
MAKNDVKIKLVGEDKLSDSIKKVKKELKDTAKAGKSLDDLKAKFDRLQASTKPFNVKIKETKRLMVELSQEYDGEGSAYWYKMADSVAGYQDALKAANADITTLGSGTKNFEALTSAASGFAGALGIVNGAMALFGDNEELSEAAKKAQGAIAMMQGIASLANTLDVHSKLMVVIRERWQEFKNALSAAEVANSAYATSEVTKNSAIAASTVAQTANTMSTTTAAAANTGLAASSSQVIASAIEKQKVLVDEITTISELITQIESLNVEYVNGRKVLKGLTLEQKQYVTQLRETLKLKFAESEELLSQSLAAAKRNNQLKQESGLWAQIKAGWQKTRSEAKKLTTDTNSAAAGTQKLTLAAIKSKAGFAIGAFGAKTFSMALNAIPMMGFITLITLAIQWLTNFYSKTKEVKPEITAIETSTSKAIKSLKELKDKIGTSVGEAIGKFKLLQTEWGALKSQNEKTKWIKNNSEAFKQLGLEIKGVSDAQKAFVTDTDTYIQKMVSIAKMTALAAMITEAFKTYVSEVLKLDKEKDEAIKRAGNMDSLYEDLNKGKSGINQKLIGGYFDSQKEALEKSFSEEIDQIIKQYKVLVGENSDYLLSSAEKGSTKSKQTYEKGSIAYLEALKKETEAKITNKKVTLEEADALRLLVRQLDLYIEARKRAIKLNATTDELFSTSDNYRWAKKKLNVPLQPDKGGLTKMKSETSKQISNLYNQEELKKQWDKNMELKAWESQFKKIEYTANAVGSTFNNLGSAIEGIGDSMDNAAGKIIGGLGNVANSIPALVAQFKDLFYASEATAVALGVQQGAAIPFPANLAAIASVVATITSIVGSFAGKFASGGIVGGSSYAGDNLYARVNSGEMILNSTQQGNLFRMLSSGTGETGAATLEAKVKGSDLYFVLSNYNKKQAKL